MTKDIIKQARAAFTEVTAALNGLAAVETLPEDVKQLITGTAGKLEQAINKLPADGADPGPGVIELAQHQAALISDLLATITALKGSMEAQVAALNTRVETELNARVEKGELIPKDVADGLMETARNQAVDTYKAEQTRLEGRKAALAQHGLPVLDGVLEGTDDEFNARVTTAKERATKLAEKAKFDLSKQPHLARACFGDQAAFDSQLALIDELLATKPAAHPLVGAGAKDGAKPIGLI